MKKRVKLLTTIASLCLAVALMAFGVYAATSASFKVTSNISFTSTAVDVSWTLQTDGTTVDETYGTATPVNGNVNADVVLSAEKNNLSAGKVATYTVACKNDSTTTATVQVTYGIEGDDADLFTLTCEKDSATYTSGIENDLETTTTTYVITLSLKADVDLTQNISAVVTISGTADVKA